MAIAGSFHYSGNLDGLLSRFGAISTLAGLQYWSHTENGWRTLITQATALDGSDPTRPRGDFTVTEMMGGLDSLLSTVQMPGDVPVAVVAAVLFVGVPTPVADFIYAALLPVELKARAEYEPAP